MKNSKKKVKKSPLDKMINRFKASTYSMDYFSKIENERRKTYMCRMRNANTYKKTAKDTERSPLDFSSEAYKNRNRAGAEEALSEYYGLTA